MVLSHHLGVDALSRLQISWTSELDQLALLHHHYFVRVLQSRQSMGNCQNCTLFELLCDDLLDEGVIFNIDIGSGLINEDHFAVLEEGPADAKKLFLSC